MSNLPTCCLPLLCQPEAVANSGGLVAGGVQPRLTGRVRYAPHMPHKLDGPRAKIKRADYQFAAFQTELKDFFESNPYEVGLAEFDGREGHHNLRVKSGPSILPDVWGAVIGDIAHDLRSALDGLAWQLALLKVSNPGRNTSFPIFQFGCTKKLRPDGTPVSQYSRDATRAIKKIDRKFWTRIESFQPFKLGNGGKSSPLFLLHELNRIDKHRLITVLAATPSGIKLSGHFGKSRLKRKVHLHPGAKVGDVQPLPARGVTVLDLDTLRVRREYEVLVNASITPTGLFGSSCDAVKGRYVTPTLRDMVDEVSRVIESFSEEFE